MALMAIAGEGSRRDEAESVLRLAAPRLLAIAAIILGTSNDAEDVVQEVMIRAWRAWDRLREPASRDAWLTRICVRESVHHGQKLRARWLHEDVIDDRRAFSSSSQPDGPGMAHLQC
jgi:DNA-directed RNA polymerase specialized sigma24 family protein